LERTLVVFDKIKHILVTHITKDNQVCAFQ